MPKVSYIRCTDCCAQNTEKDLGKDVIRLETELNILRSTHEELKVESKDMKKTMEKRSVTYKTDSAEFKRHLYTAGEDVKKAVEEKDLEHSALIEWQRTSAEEKAAMTTDLETKVAEIKECLRSIELWEKSYKELEDWHNW